MKKEIRIFLASSITEFAIERDKLELFIRNISDDFEDTYNIKIRPYRCENIDPAMSKTRKQDVYNELIKGSEMCFFIFFTKIGEFTKEEFEVAYEAFKGNGKPKIYIYFKNIPEGVTVEQEVIDFMNKIDNEFSHYHGTFDDIDTIKLRILLSLKIQEMDFLPIEISEGRCFVNGKEVRGIQIDNVSEFANNNYLNKMKDDLSSIEKQYNVMFSDYSSGRDDEDFLKQYSEVVTKRKNLITDIEELQKNIFNLSLRMCQDEIHGEITIRQKEAYRLFEQGKYKEANDIFDFDEIKNEYKRKKAMRKAEQKREARIFIREIKQKIDMLSMLQGLSTKYSDEIEKCYEEIVPEVIENLEEVGVIREYAKFLELQKNYDKSVKAEELYLKANEIFNGLGDSNSEKLVLLKIDNYKQLGRFYRLLKPEQSIQYYLKVIELSELLVEKDAERFGNLLINSYLYLANFYFYQNQREKAEEWYLKMVEKSQEWANENLRDDKILLIESYFKLGGYYIACLKKEKGENIYTKAIMLNEEMVKKSPQQYIGLLIKNYELLGKYYSLCTQEKAEEYYFKIVEKYEEFFEENPFYYLSKLVGLCYTLDLFFSRWNKQEKIEEYCCYVVGKCEKITSENPKIYDKLLIEVYRFLVSFYKKHGQKEKTLFYKQKADEVEFK